MATKLETMVSSSLAQSAEQPAPKSEPTEEQRLARQKAHDERVARWRQIEAAGKEEDWIVLELRKKGVLVDPSSDPASMGDKERGNYKEAKKIEAAERRAQIGRAHV